MSSAPKPGTQLVVPSASPSRDSPSSAQTPASLSPEAARSRHQSLRREPGGLTPCVPAPPQGAPRVQSTGPAVKASWVTLWLMAPTSQALALPSPQQVSGSPRRTGHQLLSHLPPLLSTEPNPRWGDRCRDLPQVCPAAGRSERHCSRSLPHGREPQPSAQPCWTAPAQGPGLPWRGDRFFPSPEGFREECPSLIPTGLPGGRGHRPGPCTALPGDREAGGCRLPVRIREGHSCAESRGPGCLGGPQLPLRTAPWVSCSRDTAPGCWPLAAPCT